MIEALTDVVTRTFEFMIYGHGWIFPVAGGVAVLVTRALEVRKGQRR